MSSRNLLNLVLLLVIIVLAVFVLLSPEQDNKPQPDKLTRLKAKDVNKILLQRKNADEILLHKEKGIWYMDKPYTHHANDFRIQSLLRLLQTDSFSTHDISTLDSSKFDLHSPRASVVFNDNLKIDFGGTEPLQQYRYVRIADNMHLIPDTFYYQVTGKASTFMSHALLPPGKIRMISLPDMKLAFENHKWQLKPKRDDISADSITDLLNNWRNAQAIRLMPYKGHAAKANIHIAFSDKRADIRFSIHKTADEFSLIRLDNKLQYILSQDKAEALLKLPDADPESAQEQDPLAATSRGTGSASGNNSGAKPGSAPASQADAGKK